MEKHREKGFPVTSLRLAHPYGPRDHLLYTTGRESLFLDRMRHGRTIIIPAKERTRTHPIYVKDAARAFVHVLGRTECMGKIYNLAGNEILTMDEYFASIARALGVPLVARKLPYEWFRDNAELWSDWRRNFNFGYNWAHYESAFDITALRQTGFRCQTDHDTGVALTMEWLDSNGLVDASSNEDEEDQILAYLTNINKNS
jgi:nucleoside-diphosphate-sugar epimerase